MLKYLMAALLMMAAACAPSGRKDGNARYSNIQAEEHARQKSYFSPAMGTYEGTYDNGKFKKNVKLVLEEVIEETGETFPNGMKKTRIDMRATLYFVAPVEPSIVFSTSFIPEKNQISMRKKETGSGPGGNNPTNGGGENNNTSNSSDNFQISRINTVLQRESETSPRKIVGEVFSSQGKLGNINLEFSATSNDNSGEDEDAYYDRLRQDYKEIVGLYEGKSIKGKNSHKFQLEVYMVFDTENVKMPLLEAIYHREGDKTCSGRIRFKNANYRRDMTPHRLIMSGVPIFREPNNPYRADFEGEIDGRQYVGQWQSSQNGFEGNFELKRVSESNRYLCK